MAKRRRNGEGCFSKNGNGFDYRIPYKDENNKTKYKYFWGKTKEICTNKAIKWKNEQNGIYDNDINANCTIKQWANIWFDNYVVNHVKLTTINDDRSILDKHIIPGIGDRTLKNLTSHTLTIFYNNCLKKSNGRGGTLDPKTVKNIRAVVNRMLEEACMQDIIKENPNKKAKYPKCSKKEAPVLNKNDYEKLIKFCLKKGTQWDCAIVFILCMGTRLGETLGLQWSKIDFENNTIRIDQQLQAIPNKDENINQKFVKQIIDSTKTKNSNRTLPISDDIKTILKHVHRLQAKSKIKLGSKYHKDLDLVFPRLDGYYTCDTTFRDFVNKRLEEAGINHYKIHSFRHSCATALFEEKADIKLVSKWLGHSCTGITYDIYTHVLPHHLEEIPKMINNRFKKIFNNNDIPDEYMPHKGA